MLSIEYTVVCKRGGRGWQTEADLEGSPLMRMIGREGPTQVTGVITVSGPGADKLDLGQRIRITLEPVA